MKYLTILFVFLSIQVFSQSEEQKEIYLQTHPDDQYVIKYTFGEYVLRFDYNDFLENLNESAATVKEIRSWMDEKIQSQGFFDLSDRHQKLIINGKEASLSIVTDKRNIVPLIRSGNIIIEDASGRSTVSALNIQVAPRAKKDPDTLKGYLKFIDQATGKVVFVNEIREWRMTICPSF